VLTPHKSLTTVTGHHVATDQPISGYEMHIGHTQGSDTRCPFLTLNTGQGIDGAQSPDGLVSGTYIHGLFTKDGFRDAYLRTLGGSGATVAYDAEVEATLDALGDHLAASLDTQALLAAAG